MNAAVRSILGMMDTGLTLSDALAVVGQSDNPELRANVIAALGY